MVAEGPRGPRGPRRDAPLRNPRPRCASHSSGPGKWPPLRRAPPHLPGRAAARSGPGGSPGAGARDAAGRRKRPRQTKGRGPQRRPGAQGRSPARQRRPRRPASVSLFGQMTRGVLRAGRASPRAQPPGPPLPSAVREKPRGECAPAGLGPGGRQWGPGDRGAGGRRRPGVGGAWAEGDPGAGEPGAVGASGEGVLGSGGTWGQESWATGTPRGYLGWEGPRPKIELLNHQG